MVGALSWNHELLSEIEKPNNNSVSSFAYLKNFMKMKDSINEELSSIHNTTAQSTPFNKLKDESKNSFFGKPRINHIIFTCHCSGVIGKIG